MRMLGKDIRAKCTTHSLRHLQQSPKMMCTGEDADSLSALFAVLGTVKCDSDHGAASQQCVSFASHKCGGDDSHVSTQL